MVAPYYIAAKKVSKNNIFWPKVCGRFLNFSEPPISHVKLSRISAGGEADGIGVDDVGPRGKNWSERGYEVMADRSTTSDQRPPARPCSRN